MTRVILFDIGGVLVELAGVAKMLEWMGGRTTTEELWRRWLTSETVRSFETGRIDSTTFGVRAVDEFGLGIAPSAFVDAFAAWPTGLYPGTLELLARIPQHYTRAVLSNSNGLHWERIRDDMGLGAAIEHHFVSHLTGRIKPDAEAFLHVSETLGCAPREVLFLDDNQLNVDAARGVGMQAMVAKGRADAERVLVSAGVIAR
jgi:HAD superfamily hydrolase (TIGR01509 family)